MAICDTGVGSGSCEWEPETDIAVSEDGNVPAISSPGSAEVYRRTSESCGDAVINFPKPKVSVKGLGKVMARSRHQNGFVKPTGKKPRTWTGYWYEYRTLPDGTEKRFERSKVLGTQAELTKTQAKEKLRDHINGHRPEPHSTFEVAAQNYLGLKQGDWSPRNREVMTSLFNVHILPHLGKTPIKDIKPSDVKRWINGIGASFSRSITQKSFTHVRAIFDQLVEDDVIAKNPARSKKNRVRVPKTRKPSERFLSPDEAYRLLQAATDPRDHLLLHILMTCGIRPSEAFALQRKDVLPGELRIDQAFVMGEISETKTEASDGKVPIGPKLEQELQEYLAAQGISAPEAYLFPCRTGMPYDPKNYLNRKLKPLAKRAGVADVTFQVLRRTCATHLNDIAGPKVAQTVLRHTNSATTMKHYIKPVSQSVHAGVEAWERLLSEEPDRKPPNAVIPFRKRKTG